MSSIAGVVVTGLGVIAGPACGRGELGEILSGRSMPSSEVDRCDGYHLPASARTAVTGSDLDLSRWVSPSAARRMSPPSKLAVAAARMAIEDAGLADANGAERTAVVMSVAFGAIHVTASLLRTIFNEGPEMASPFTFTESVANAATAQIAIASRAKGPNLTIAQGEAGVLTAVGRGAAEVAAGRADRALVGSVQEMSPILHALLDRFGALARPAGPGGEVARPFDRARNGFVAAEGAVVLVLESESRALERRARIHARVRGFGGAFDPTAPRVGWGHGHRELASALRSTCDRAGVAPGDIDRIVSGASGSIEGDRLEAHTLRSAWGDSELPPILAPKGVTGEYGGGFLAAAVLALSDQDFGPTGGFTDADPDLLVTPYRGEGLNPASLALATSLASGGAASWLLLERV